MTSAPSNPLLGNAKLPPFASIEVSHVEPAIDELLQRCRDNLAQVLANNTTGEVSWNSLVDPLEELDDQLNKAWSPVSHLNAVCNTDELREAYTSSLAKLTAYGTEVGQNHELFSAYQALADGKDFEGLSYDRQTSINHALRDFRLAGVALPEAKKQRFSELKQRLSELSTQFSNNVLDATQGWHKLIDDSSELSGLPDNALALAQQAAQESDQQGYRLTLDIPSYLAVMTHADNRQLREEMYQAYTTRASETGPNAGQWDNAPLIDEILSLRHEMAQLLGFNNYAERSLATKMAETCDQVESFLLELAAKSRAQAERDIQELREFATQIDKLEDLQAWDLAYYSEKLKQERYSVSQEQLRPYFPANKVVAGMFEVVSRLFDIHIQEGNVELWHEDVRFYDVRQEGEVIAHFYLDLYARPKKRGGAWMDECRVRRITSEDHQQLPVAYLTCNFTPALGDKPALLTHDEVVTLFHEFGHGLHHMLTRINTAAVSGINGVAWDAVELPSQFLENWCWQAEVIELLSGHHETGEPLPRQLLDNLLLAKNFQSAMQMLRQIEFALFDFRLHKNYQPDNPEPVQTVLDSVRERVAVVIPPAFNRFQNSFSHIFAGGYAAGYYSYKWAEVLSSDAFSRFEEEGIFNTDTGRSFMEEVLQQGGSREAMELFRNFRGREPKPDALLRHSGIEG
ncbi:oligopeptidase A [Pseudomaricurvus alkylphenolicus]|uniref:oligopeptidase A n=1 Tax=Pseudomaricurvus alkylphenolicus TaxID=1306991 RepID=UPI00142317D5|nr:oligopeptidase A [Pseudomaricurvus alkylphenolicus]NIB39517.1 oligopeptidase A [Pseudomaricurvus alkylphenolicus]